MAMSPLEVPQLRVPQNPVLLLKVLQLRVPPLRAPLRLVLPVPVLLLRVPQNMALPVPVLPLRVPQNLALLPRELLNLVLQNTVLQVLVLPEPVPQAPPVQELPHSLSPPVPFLLSPCPLALFPPSPCPPAVSPAAQPDQVVTLPTPVLPAVPEARARTASLVPVDFSSGSAVSWVRARARVLVKARVREKAMASPRATIKWLGLNDYPWAYGLHLTDE